MKRTQAEFWDGCFARTPPDLEHLASIDFSATIGKLKQCRVKRVLDLGCGYGQWTIALAKSGFDVSSVDISSEAIRILRGWALQEGLSIRSKECAAQELIFPKGSFDAVICNSVLDHMCLKDTKRVVGKIKNVLIPDGIAYVSFDGFEEENHNNYDTLPDGTWSYRKGRHAGMLWRYCTDEEIRDLCKGFTITEFTIKKSNGKRSVWLHKPAQQLNGSAAQWLNCSTAKLRR